MLPISSVERLCNGTMSIVHLSMLLVERSSDVGGWAKRFE